MSDPRQPASRRSMFAEKAGEGLSMTRVIALLFGICVCAALLIYAWRAVDVGWPFALLGVATLLAVPIQALFKGKYGRELTEKLLARFGTREGDKP